MSALDEPVMNEAVRRRKQRSENLDRMLRKYSVTPAAYGFERDVEGQKAIEQWSFAIEAHFLETFIWDVILSVFEKPEPEKGAKDRRLHRVTGRIPWRIEHTIDRNRE